MRRVICDDVRRFMYTTPDSHQHHLLLQAYAAHVAGCQRCRGALALLAAALVVPPPAQQPSDMVMQNDLAAYVEREAEDGLAVAARAFPHVWWTLWSDAEYAEVYEATRALYRAMERGELAPPPSGRPALPAIELIRLPRALLAHGLGGPAASYGLRRSSDDTAITLLDDEPVQHGYSMSFKVTLQEADVWSASVAVEPPVRGTLLLSFDAQEFRARFDADSVAIVNALPNALLTADSGPDLAVRLLHDA